jgi:hypothetical protein
MVTRVTMATAACPGASSDPKYMFFIILLRRTREFRAP